MLQRMVLPVSKIVDFFRSNRVRAYRMKRQIHIVFQYLSVFLAVVAGFWLVLPRDICLTQMIVGDGCVCLVETDTNAGCLCCPEGRCDKAESFNHTVPETDGLPAEPSGEQPGCFSVSSELAQVTGPERAPSTTPVMGVVAILPLPADPVIDRRWDFSPDSITSAAAYRTMSYKDNCVFLI